MPDLTVAILRSIRDELTSLRRELRGEMSELRGEMRTGFAEVHSGLATVTARLENIRDLAGDKWRDHEHRIKRLERRAG